MFERRRALRLGVPAEISQNHLDGDRAVQDFIARLVYHPHRPPAQLLDIIIALREDIHRVAGLGRRGGRGGHRIGRSRRLDLLEEPLCLADCVAVGGVRLPEQLEILEGLILLALLLEGHGDAVGPLQPILLGNPEPEENFENPLGGVDIAAGHVDLPHFMKGPGAHRGALARRLLKVREHRLLAALHRALEIGQLEMSLCGLGGGHAAGSEEFLEFSFRPMTRAWPIC